MSKKKILLVDDSDSYQQMARSLLEARGYEVVTLSSPFGFGAALTRERPDLALVDALMPALQGDQLIRMARQNNLWDCPIVLHSDRSLRELQQMVEASGATGFIPKMTDPDKIVLAIEDFLKAAAQAIESAKKSISAPMEPLSASRRSGALPESYRPPAESYHPPPESYRPPLESRSPPESRRPLPPDHRPAPLESVAQPPATRRSPLLQGRRPGRS
jgi:CheY-like chemotaxis protein